MGSMTLDEIVLPPDLRWTDEFDWSPIVRSVDFSLTGAVIINEARKLAGRPITLEAKSEQGGYIWAERSTIVALYNKCATTLLQMVLTFPDGRTFNVAFRDEGLIAEPVIYQAGETELVTLPYTFTLKLQTVS